MNHANPYLIGPIGVLNVKMDEMDDSDSPRHSTYTMSQESSDDMALKVNEGWSNCAVAANRLKNLKINYERTQNPQQKAQLKADYKRDLQNYKIQYESFLETQRFYQEHGMPNWLAEVSQHEWNIIKPPTDIVS